MSWFGPRFCNCGCLISSSSSSSSSITSSSSSLSYSSDDSSSSSFGSSSSSSRDIDPCDCDDSNATYYVKIVFSGFPDQLDLYGRTPSGCPCRIITQIDCGVLNGTYFVPLQRICSGAFTQFVMRDPVQLISQVQHRIAVPVGFPPCAIDMVETVPVPEIWVSRWNPNPQNQWGGILLTSSVPAFIGIRDMPFPSGDWCDPVFDFSGEHIINFTPFMPECPQPSYPPPASITWELVPGEL